MDKNTKNEVTKMIERSGMTRAAFARKYHIPIRTLENWVSGKCSCPGYVLNLLNRCITQPPAPLYSDVMPLGKLRDKCDLTRAAFSKEYNIPVATLKRWEGGTSKCPPYVAEMLERCVRFDHLPVYFCTVHLIDEPGGCSAWYFLHSQIMYPVYNKSVRPDYPLKSFTSKHSIALGYDNVRSCVNEARKSRKALRSSIPGYKDSDFVYRIVRLEEVLENLDEIERCNHWLLRSKAFKQDVYA